MYPSLKLRTTLDAEVMWSSVSTSHSVDGEILPRVGIVNSASGRRSLRYQLRRDFAMRNTHALGKLSLPRSVPHGRHPKAAAPFIGLQEVVVTRCSTTLRGAIMVLVDEAKKYPHI